VTGTTWVMGTTWQRRNGQWIKANSGKATVAYSVLSTATYFALGFAWGPHEHLAARAIGATVFGVLTGITRYFHLRLRDRQGPITT
jgi:hypothetical protein